MAVIHTNGGATFNVNEEADAVGRLIAAATRDPDANGEGWLRLTRFSSSKPILIRAAAVTALEA